MSSNDMNTLIRRAAGYSSRVEQQVVHQVDDGPTTPDVDQGQPGRTEPRRLTMDDRIRIAVGIEPW